MNPIKVAIIGSGKRGHQHARGYAASDAVQVVAVVDPILEAGQTLAAQFGAAVYTDMSEMLEAHHPEMVSVCTWPGQHRQQVMAAIGAGAKAILCEKPMAPTMGESRAMHLAAEKAGVQLSFCHQRRFSREFIKTRELIREGAIGAILRFEGFCSNLYDWGTHWFDMFGYFNEETPARWVMGQIEYVGARTVFGVPVDRAGLSYICFENEVHALLATGKENGGGCSVRVIGTQGMIELPQADGGEVRLLRAGHDWENVLMEESLDQNILAVLGCIESLQNGTEPELSSRKALAATELIFATYESSRTRGRVSLPLEIEDSPLISLLESAEAARVI